MTNCKCKKCTCDCHCGNDCDNCPNDVCTGCQCECCE